MLLEAGADIEAKTEDGSDPALILAAEKGYNATVRRLLTVEADVDARNAKGYTAPTLAARYGHPRLIQTLLDHGADIETKCTEGVPSLTGSSTA